ncbi:MAG: hypothetical protein EX260_06210 [Desulfobulbaceae bacterium]|nr:MAG: hypothetical protein EX260_06210 [Desulfobulbaceae bacterium]
MNSYDTPSHSALDTVKIAIVELLRKRRLAFAVGFAVINIVAIVAALNWPKVFTSSMTVYVQEQEILGRLMEGEVGRSGLKDQALLAREIVTSRSVLRAVLESTGDITEGMAPKEIEGRIESLKRGVKVTGVTGTRRRDTNLIRIAYTDPDPQRAFEITGLLGEQFIAETTAAKVRESTSVFNFVDSQVKEYEAKLRESDEVLMKFRAENETVAPGAEAEVRRRISDLRSEISVIEQQLREASIRRRSLRAQLAGEADKAEGLSRLEELRSRRRQLQARLDALRLTYFETYPDIINVKAQIAEIDEVISREEQSDLLSDTMGEGDSSGLMTVSQQLRQALYNTNTLIATLESRLVENKTLLEKEQSKAVSIPDAEAKLTELTRDYSVTKRIYEDLLRRRELSRVSMNVDRERKSLSLTVDEPAFFPYQPSGVSFWQIIAGGLALSILLPPGLVFLRHNLDGRIRLVEQLQEESGLEVLAAIPTYPSPKETRTIAVSNISAAFVITVSAIAVGFVTYLKWAGNL